MVCLCLVLWFLFGFFGGGVVWGLGVFFFLVVFVWGLVFLFFYFGFCFFGGGVVDGGFVGLFVHLFLSVLGVFLFVVVGGGVVGLFVWFCLFFCVLRLS